MPGIFDMGIGKAPRQGICRSGYCYEMSMISHEAVCPDIYTILHTGFFQKLYIVTIILIIEKYILPAIASLYDVMRILWYNNPCNACHNGLKNIFSFLSCQYKLVAVPNISNISNIS
jgi:hypothetical protein